MIHIVDTTGRTVGYVRNDDTDERVRRMIEDARDYANQRPNGSPILNGIRERRDRMSKRAKVTAVVLAVFAALWTLGTITGPDDVTVSAPVPTSVPAAVSVPPVVPMTPRPSAPVVSWSGEVTDASGQKVDTVYRAGSPVRAEYLGVLASHGIPVGVESSAVLEGVTFCMDVARGSTVALRERTDVVSPVSSFGTGERRKAVASAALTVFCPNFL